ncbi:hypothetical protein DW979_01815 [Eubacterium sp. AM49-13BH]|nr:hypothetical protein DW979_01815 [Eubacterium sp. AM49-13BH]
MGININEKYEIAYDFYGKILEEIDADSLNERISLAIEKTIESMSALIEDADALRDYLLSRISREKEEETVSVMLGEEAENSTWWDEYRAENAKDLKFWNRYSKYLFERKHWEKSAITKSIGNPTDMLLNAIADPNRTVAQEKRAMVVGYVQSGKTANYIGLINKALDAGYKYIIVLAGIHNNLRSQTQSRIDEEVLGYETSSEARQKQRERAEKNRIGVGTLYNAGFVQTLTFRDESGDFSKKNSSWDTHPDVPTIIVTKKIKSTLTNLIENIESKQVVKQDENGHFVMPAKYPLLLIDDEADQASVNTGYDYDDDGNIIDEYDVKTINRLIRNLLNHFECKSYVGYTATPYANIFIPNDLAVAGEDLGNDLFPADCIISLPKPYRYIGANEFFGYGIEDEEPKPMPLVRKIKDEDFIDVKKKGVRELPNSLKKAMKCFLISIAIRNCRGELYKPNTMLIHVARIKNMHKQLERKVSEYFYDELQSMIIDGDSETKAEIYDLIREEYLPISEKMRKDFPRYMENAYDVDEDEIYEEIVRLMNEDRVKINVINGDSKDVLCYKDHEGEEYNVIAIGGDKFSRGLTLEGLSISYFTRESKYYDTLMQMGRWFGFRPKYADLCRVFITDIIYRWFARIAFATDNLRNQITYMCDEKAKPRDFGLRVATHPELKISSPKKVKSGTIQQLDFSATLTVTRDIDVNIEMYDSNYKAVNHLFSYAEKILTAEEHFAKLGRETNTEHYFIENVNSTRIIEFFRNYQTSKRARKVNGNNIATYIEEQNKDGLLVNWTVCLINTGEDVPGFEIAGKHIKNGITRKSENSIVPQEDTCSVHMLKSKDQEYYDMSLSEYEEIKQIEDKGDEKTVAEHIRATKMDPKKGLLLIYPIDHRDGGKTSLFKIGDGNHMPPFGLVVVFPKGNGKSISYQVNQVGMKGDLYDFFD